MSLQPEVAKELLKMADIWAKEGREELAHHALDVIGGDGEQTEPPCPICGAGGERTEDTGTFSAPRKTCKQCGKSWNPKEANRG